MYTILTPVFGLFQKKKKKQEGELKVGFPGVNFKKHGIFQGDQETKNYMEFPGVLVLDLKSSEGCNRSLWSFWGKTLFFLEFSEIK